MKFCAGNSYKEAISNKPICGIKKTDKQTIEQIYSSYDVVLEYKEVIRKSNYRWVHHGPFCIYVQNKEDEKYVMAKVDGVDKIRIFKSIRLAMEYIYIMEEEKFRTMHNYSMKQK